MQPMQVAGTPGLLSLLELIPSGVTPTALLTELPAAAPSTEAYIPHDSNPLAAHSNRNQAPRSIPAASPDVFWTLSKHWHHTYGRIGGDHAGQGCPAFVSAARL